MVLGFSRIGCDRTNYLFCEKEIGGKKMTLLEMIKKYERIKEDLLKPRLPDALGALDTADSLEIVDHILKDLRGILKDTSEITIHNTLLEKISHALEKSNLDDALTLVHMLQMLSD